MLSTVSDVHSAGRAFIAGLLLECSAMVMTAGPASLFQNVGLWRKLKFGS